MAHFGGLFSGRSMVLTVDMSCLAGINFKGIAIEMELIRAKTVPRKISAPVAVFSENWQHYARKVWGMVGSWFMLLVKGIDCAHFTIPLGARYSR